MRGINLHPSVKRNYPSDCVNRKLRDFSRSFLYIDFVKNQILWTFLKNC